MTFKILRRPKAALDVESIADYIAKDSLHAVLRFLENVELTIKALADSPGSGVQFNSTLPELANLRFRRVQGFPNHIVFFFEKNEAIEVVRILHGAQDLDSKLGNT
jgi:toxin ParE1/3/4